MVNIAKKARQEYLGREFRNFDYLKSYPEPQINGHLKQVKPFPQFHTKPMFHQKVAFLLGTSFPHWHFFMEVGTGKSWVALNLMNHWVREGSCKRFLVLVPNVVNIDAWEEEIAKHAPNLSVTPLLGGTEDRVKSINLNNSNVFVLNYQGLVYLCTSAFKNGKKSKQGKRKIDKEKIKWFQQSFDGIIMDESQNIKSHNSIAYQILNSSADHFNVVYALTGTPFGRDPHDLWSQFKVVDRGETFGENMSLFRAVFFNQKINYWGGYEYKFKKQMEKKLYEMIKNRALYYSADECLDLPEKSYRRITVDFPEGAEAYYKKIVKEVIGSNKKSTNNSEKENAFMKMRQISSGFVNVGEPGEEKVKIDFPDNPKMTALMTFLDGLAEDEKVVIFNEFVHSGDLICQELDRRKIKHSRLYSGTKDHAEQVRKFKKNKSCRVIVVNSASGGTGINLQVARYAVFYESPVSPLLRTQTEARVHRSGQTRKVFIYDIVMKNTVEQKILHYINEGQDLMKALLDGREGWQ